MVRDDGPSDLPHLVGLCIPAVALQIQDIPDPGLCEDVVASMGAFGEPQRQQQHPQSVEAHRGIAGATEHLGVENCGVGVPGGPHGDTRSGIVDRAQELS